VHGVELDGLAVEAAGRTDAAIARDLLRAAGVPDAAIDARAGEVAAAAVVAYEELCPPDLSAYVAPGVEEALDALAGEPGTYRLALLTGNLEPVARRKLASAGIGRYFAAGEGGFGSDAEDRAALPAVARRRAGGWPRERTVVIGDTPRDIACARADRVRVIAVATGPFSAEALADADAVVDSARAVLPVLSDWAGG
jgi:phosphoglycolate phosphatase